jgi:hypothetical protein
VMRMGDLFGYYGTDLAGMATTLVALWGLGNRRRWGFAWGMTSNVCWGAFAVLAGSAPTVVTNVLCFLLSLRGWIRWGSPSAAVAVPPVAGPVSGG